MLSKSEAVPAIGYRYGYDDATGSRAPSIRTAPLCQTARTSTSDDAGLPMPWGNAVFLRYDDAGNLTQSTDRLGRVTQCTDTGSGQKLTTTDPRGGVTTYAYEFAATASRTDAAPSVEGTKTTSVTTSPTASRTQHSSDDDSLNPSRPGFRSNELSTTDEAGHTTSCAYDLAGQLGQTTYPGGTFTRQTFDALGRLRVSVRPVA